MDGLYWIKISGTLSFALTENLEAVSTVSLACFFGAGEGNRTLILGLISSN
jgi:hypothetical protein